MSRTAVTLAILAAADRSQRGILFRSAAAVVAVLWTVLVAFTIFVDADAVNGVVGVAPLLAILIGFAIAERFCD